MGFLQVSTKRMLTEKQNQSASALFFEQSRSDAEELSAVPGSDPRIPYHTLVVQTGKEAKRRNRILAGKGLGVRIVMLPLLLFLHAATPATTAATWRLQLCLRAQLRLLVLPLPLPSPAALSVLSITILKESLSSACFWGLLP